MSQLFLFSTIVTMIRTHYDNLQVTRNATDVVIRAAYKGLAQKYHPDKFVGARAEAERVMKILNEAYAVLADPTRRKQHDEWIDQELAAEKARSRALNKDGEIGRELAEKEGMPAAMAARNSGASIHRTGEIPPQYSGFQERVRQQRQYKELWTSLSSRAKGHWCLFGTLVVGLLAVGAMVVARGNKPSIHPDAVLLAVLCMMGGLVLFAAAVLYYLESVLPKRL